MNLKEAFNYAKELLNKNNIDEAEFKAECVVCHIAGIRNNQFKLKLDCEIDTKKLDEMLNKLLSNEPLQYVIGKWDFYESEFYVGKGVLIPRPETEELVELAVEKIKSIDECVVYDLCAGSGCIGISVAKACPNSKVYLVEKSDEALYYLNKNAENINNAFVVKGDITSVIELTKADVIISNPPYIKSDDVLGLQREVLKEPVEALDGGADGLDFYRIINDKWTSRLKENGSLYLEIGNEQGESIVPVLNKYKEIKVIKDMYGNDRMVVARKG